jgi:hypothetical protein
VVFSIPGVWGARPRHILSSVVVFGRTSGLPGAHRGFRAHVGEKAHIGLPGALRASGRATAFRARYGLPGALRPSGRATGFRARCGLPGVLLVDFRRNRGPEPGNAPGKAGKCARAVFAGRRAPPERQVPTPLRRPPRRSPEAHCNPSQVAPGGRRASGCSPLCWPAERAPHCGSARTPS